MNMFKEYREILTFEELCEILDIGKNTAYFLLHSKQIKAFKIGSNWKIPKQAIEEYVRQNSGF